VNFSVAASPSIAIIVDAKLRLTVFGAVQSATNILLRISFAFLLQEEFPIVKHTFFFDPQNSEGVRFGATASKSLKNALCGMMFDDGVQYIGV